jgi:hypothetical protein
MTNPTDLDSPELALDISDVRKEAKHLDEPWLLKTEDLFALDHMELAKLAHRLADTAHLWKLHCEEVGCYVSFYTGVNGSGAPLRETFYRKHWDWNDSTLHAMAERRAKKLGASSWVVLKPIGVVNNVWYGRDDDARLDYLEANRAAQLKAEAAQ